MLRGEHGPINLRVASTHFPEAFKIRRENGWNPSFSQDCVTIWMADSDGGVLQVCGHLSKKSQPIKLDRVKSGRNIFKDVKQKNFTKKQAKIFFTKDLWQISGANVTTGLLSCGQEIQASKIASLRHHLTHHGHFEKINKHHHNSHFKTPRCVFFLDCKFITNKESTTTTTI